MFGLNILRAETVKSGPEKVNDRVRVRVRKIMDLTVEDQASHSDERYVLINDKEFNKIFGAEL